MPIFYNKVRKVVNPNAQAGQEIEYKWFPVAKAIRKATQKDIAKYISRETTLNPKEAEMAIAMLAEATDFYLKQGYTVSLGDWASFNVTLTAKGSASEKDCGPEDVTKVVPHCRFSKSFVSELQNDVTYQIGTSLESVGKSSSYSEENEGGGSGSGSGGEITE